MLSHVIYIYYIDLHFETKLYYTKEGILSYIQALIFHITKVAAQVPIKAPQKYHNLIQFKSFLLCALFQRILKVAHNTLVHSSEVTQQRSLLPAFTLMELFVILVLSPGREWLFLSTSPEKKESTVLERHE